MDEAKEIKADSPLPKVDRDWIFCPEDFLHLGWIFISDDALRDSGYYPREFDVVNIGGLHYELQGYIETADCWWIQLVDPDATPYREGDDWTPLGRSLSERLHETSVELAPAPVDLDSLMSRVSPSPSNASTSKDSLYAVTGWLKRKLTQLEKRLGSS